MYIFPAANRAAIWRGADSRRARTGRRRQKCHPIWAASRCAASSARQVPAELAAVGRAHLCRRSRSTRTHRLLTAVACTNGMREQDADADRVHLLLPRSLSIVTVVVVAVAHGTTRLHWRCFAARRTRRTGKSRPAGGYASGAGCAMQCSAFVALRAGIRLAISIKPTNP